MRIFLNSVVGAWRAVEATHWGGLLLVNVWPAYLFALPLAARVWSDLHTDYATTLDGRARLLQEVLTTIFLALVVVLFAVRRRKIAGQHAGWLAGAVALLGTFLLNAVAFLPVESSTSVSVLLASSAVIIVGTLFTTWSLAILGRCFGLFPEARGLVVRGPYRLVRHPVYLGELISALGLVIARPHLVILVLLVAFVALQYGRIVYEERALTEAYPDEYSAYSRQVRRLLPGWPA